MPDKIKVTGDFYTVVDGFGYDEYAKTLLDIITAADFPTPFTFGIFGEWGSGKTSLMRMIEAELRVSHPDIIVPVWFNPWRYEKEEHLIIPFLKTIQQSIDQHIEDNKNALKKLSDDAVSKLKKLGGRLSKIAFAVFSSIGTEVELGAAEQKLKLKVDLAKGIEIAQKIEEKQKLEEQLGGLKEYSSAYFDIIRYLNEVAQEEPRNLLIVVFIDDLDRCLPEKAIELLEGIKTFLDITGYVFFIGVDRSVIEKGVKVKYKGYAIADKSKDEGMEGKNGSYDTEAGIPITPADYLEKLVQLPVSLPPIDKSRVEEYLLTLTEKNKALIPFLDIIQLGLKQNPRTYKRFINTLAFHTKLAVEKGCLDKGVASDGSPCPSRPDKPLMTLELLVKWTIINFGFTDLVTAMKRRKLLIVELQDWIERIDNERKTPTDQGSMEEKRLALQIPDHIDRWLKDEKLMNVLRKNSERGDAGFSKDTIDLYIQMGEFTSSGISASAVLAQSSRKADIGDMVRIPKGKFLYGDKKEEREIPEDYEIDVFPVTNSRYKAFIDEEKYDVPYREESWAQAYNWDKDKRTYPEGKAEHPVVLVSYHDALAYCEWRSKKEGRSYRLPTETEWEKAARGTDGRVYPWGDEFDASKCNTGESGIGTTTPVDKYPEGVSPYGCYDMAGNVWEWTDSWYDEEEKYKALRGGSWSVNDEYARCAYRYGNVPDTWSFSLGFRCART